MTELPVEEPAKKKKRGRPPTKPKKKVREFKTPEVDWSVAHYSNFIDNVPQEEKTMPPVLADFSVAELTKAAEDPQCLSFLKEICCTTQPCERCIKRVTAISTVVKSEERREEQLANLHYSTALTSDLPHSKKEWVCHQ